MRGQSDDIFEMSKQDGPEEQTEVGIVVEERWKNYIFEHGDAFPHLADLRIILTFQLVEYRLIISRPTCTTSTLESFHTLPRVVCARIRRE